MTKTHSDLDFNLILSAVAAAFWGFVAWAVTRFCGGSTRLASIIGSALALVVFLVIILVVALGVSAAREEPKPRKIILHAEPLYRLRFDEKGQYQIDGIPMSQFPMPETQAPDPNEVRCCCLEQMGDNPACPVHGVLA